MTDASWAGLFILIVSSLLGGIKFIWNYVQSNHKKDLEAKDETIKARDKKIEALEHNMAAYEATCKELREQLRDCTDSRTQLTITANRVQELHNLTVLQGEKIAALEGRVNDLSLLTKQLKSDLETKSDENNKLERLALSQGNTIVAYEKAFELLGKELKSEGTPVE